MQPGQQAMNNGKDLALLMKEGVLRAQQSIGDVSDYVLLANNAIALEIRNLLKKDGLDVVVIGNPHVPLDSVHFVHKAEIEKNGFVQIQVDSVS